MVTNNGPSTLSSFNLTDTIPAALLNPVFGAPGLAVTLGDRQIGLRAQRIGVRCRVVGRVAVGRTIPMVHHHCDIFEIAAEPRKPLLAGRCGGIGSPRRWLPLCCTRVRWG
jgi:hypothetical protein